MGWTTSLRSTPPNLLLDPPIRSTDSHKTLGILGVPHGHPIAMIWSTKVAKSRGLERFPPRTPLSRNLRKPQNRGPFPTDLWGAQGKEPKRVHAYIPNQISKGEASNPPQENHQDKTPKITKKGKMGEITPSLEEPCRINYTYHEGSYKI
jgi:hypothetical protein